MITIFEDYRNKLPDYEEHLVALKKLEELVGAQNFSLQVDGTLQVSHYVGFFQSGNTRIQILPKTFAHSGLEQAEQPEINTSLDFVYRLLHWSGYLNILKQFPQQQSASGEDLLEIFIGIFIRAFNELFRKKVHRDYVHFEENQSFIKGKILVSETIRRNPVLKHLHYTRFDEYSLNNPLNQIFKSLIFQLLAKTRSAANKKQLVIGLAFLQDVSLVPLSQKSFGRVKFNRLNTEFEPLFNFAKLFFHNQQPGLGHGKEATFCFLVPMHKLFENFIAKALDHFNDGMPVFQYHQPKWYLDEKNKAFPLEPDFTVFKGTKCVGILDAKYKYPFNGEKEKEKVKINTHDLYQLYTYALRYGCQSLALVYPKFIGAPISDTVIAEFELTSAIGPICLRVIQVDVMAKKVNEIVRSLSQGLEELFRDGAT